MRKTGKGFVCIAALVGLVATSDATAGVRRLLRMVVVGDSLLAGFGSGGFVATGRPGQVDGAATFVARRAHVHLPLPLITRPGVPPELTIVDENRNGRLDRGEVRRTQSGLGFRADPDKKVRNLAIPGEDSASVFEKINPGDVAGQLVTGDVNGRDVLKLLVLGLPPRGDAVSQVSRAKELRPSFLLVWLGSNDILEMATSTDPGAVTLSAREFGVRFRRLLGELADTRAGMAVANLPDPTGIAALRRAATDVTSCHTAGGAIQPVAPDDLLSIDLDPAALPSPSCARVLDAAEQAEVRARVTAFNSEIAGAIAETEQTRGTTIAAVDMFTAFDGLRTNGVDLDGDGVPDLTTRYLGGIFSLDGTHPTRTGHALIANVFIDAIDARFGESMPRVDVARVARRDPLARSRFRPAGEVPFGVIGDSEGDDLGSFFTKTFDRIGRDAGDIAGRIGRFF
jgi:lysophospholipase L1-like esterase